MFQQPLVDKWLRDSCMAVPAHTASSTFRDHLHCPALTSQVYNNALRDLLGGPGAPYINDQSAIKHDPAGGHTTVVGVSKVSRVKAMSDHRSSCAGARPAAHSGTQPI